MKRGSQSMIEMVEKNKKTRMVKKLIGNEDDISPVLGIKILPIDRDSVEKEKHVNTSNRENAVAGNFICCLCGKHHENAMSLAEHRCSRIVNLKYDCDQCDKTFSCPANLASHKRWHKPKNMDLVQNRCVQICERSFKSEKFYKCGVCGRCFRRDFNRKKHELIKHQTISQKRNSTDNTEIQNSLPSSTILQMQNGEIGEKTKLNSKKMENQFLYSGLKFNEKCKPSDLNYSAQALNMTKYKDGQKDNTISTGLPPDQLSYLNKISSHNYMTHYLFTQYANRYFEWRKSNHATTYIHPTLMYNPMYLQNN